MIPTVLRRSLIVHGRRGACITLPPAWVRSSGLKPGDRVEVILKDELVIRPVPRKNSPTLVRTLMRHQKSTRMNVPNKWLHSHSLKPGDRVEVIANGELIVRP